MGMEGYRGDRWERSGYGGRAEWEGGETERDRGGTEGDGKRGIQGDGRGNTEGWRDGWDQRRAGRPGVGAGDRGDPARLPSARQRHTEPLGRGAGDWTRVTGLSDEDRGLRRPARVVGTRTGTGTGTTGVRGPGTGREETPGSLCPAAAHSGTRPHTSQHRLLRRAAARALYTLLKIACETGFQSELAEVRIQPMARVVMERLGHARRGRCKPLLAIGRS